MAAMCQADDNERYRPNRRRARDGEGKKKARRCAWAVIRGDKDNPRDSAVGVGVSAIVKKEIAGGRLFFVGCV